MAAADPPPATVPRSAARRRRPPRPDRNRPLEILAGLALYIFAVHYLLKFASFLLPEADEAPGREEMLRGRGAAGVAGVLGLSLGAHLPRRSAGRAASRKFAAHHSLPGAADASATITADYASSNNSDNDHPPSPTTHKRPRIPILSYRDDHVVVSKPSGMTMHRNHHSRRSRGTIPVLETNLKKQLGRKPFLVHRLDHRTSGAVVLAFSTEKAAELHGRLRDERATKLYVALVRGDLRERFRAAALHNSDDDRGVDLSVLGDGSVVGRCGMRPAILGVDEGADAGGNSPTPSCVASSNRPEHHGTITVTMPINVDGVEKDARTDFHFLASLPAPEDNDDEKQRDPVAPHTTKSLTLLLCRPRTGRTHQIRRHAKHFERGLGAPIIGDTEHGDSRVNRHWRNEIGLDRLGLHCFHLSLPPIPDESDDGEDGDGVWMRCTAPLTEDFAGPLRHERLRPLWEEAMEVEPPLGMEPYDERGGTFGKNYRRRREEGEGDREESTGA